MLTDNPTDTPTVPANNGGDHREAGSLAARRWDKRRPTWRRRGELIALFTEALGGKAAISPVIATKVETAAELAVAAELCRASYIAASGATADDVVRTSNQAARAEKALGIGTAKPAAPKGRLADYLAGRAA